MAPPTRWRWPQLAWNADRSAGEPAGAPVQLRAARCTRCERSEFPARETCEWCGSTAVPFALPIDGRVVGHTEVKLDAPGSSVPAPYHLALVRFDTAGLDVLGHAESGVVAGDSVRCVTSQPFGGDEVHFAFRSVAPGRS